LFHLFRLLRRRLAGPSAPAPVPPDDPCVELVRYWSSGRVVIVEYRRAIDLPGTHGPCRECIELAPEEFARQGLALIQERLYAYLERPPGDDLDHTPATRKAFGARNAHHVSVTRRATGALELRPMLVSGSGRVGPPDWVRELEPPVTEEAFHAALEEAFRDSGSKLV
jgi:hypothetical protein